MRRIVLTLLPLAALAAFACTSPETNSGPDTPAGGETSEPDVDALTDSVTGSDLPSEEGIPGSDLVPVTDVPVTTDVPPGDGTPGSDHVSGGDAPDEPDVPATDDSSRPDVIVTADVPDGLDVVFADICGCRVPDDCVGQMEAPKDCEQFVCKACTCLFRPKDKGTPCDDKDDKTYGDACDGHSACVGRPASCGDGSCAPSGEDCFNCPKDCGCPADQWCQQRQCLAKPEKDNGICEPLENCRNSPIDCPCGADKACSGDACVSCTDFCKAEGLQCGDAMGCKCGTCEAGWQCSDSNQCFNPDICGNSNCETTENCGSCPIDCGCKTGQVCLKGACSECEAFCTENGKECGFFGGCDCGKATLCHKCQDNLLVPDCECLCYPASKKQCGEIEGCKCGKFEGGCAEGEECVGFQCLVGCDTLCGTKECGWAEDCMCDWCAGADVCKANTCETGTEETDSYEYNDAPEDATDLGTVTDNDTESAKEVTGNIDMGYDVDWFVVQVEDNLGETLAVNATLTGLPEDKDVDLIVCYLCKNGTLAGALATPEDAVFEIESPIPGARCFASINLWGLDEVITLNPTCSEGQNDSATVYFVVQPASEVDYGGEYTLSFHF